MIPGMLSTPGAPLLRDAFGSRSLSDIANIIIALLIAILVHELGHAIVADRLGDDTPRLAGHLSLNPFRHMDQVGILLLFLTAIGGGQVFTYGFTPVNESKLRRRSEFGPGIVALAGPMMNLLLAALLAVVGPERWAIGGNQQVFDLLLWSFNVNIFLCVFNLVPLPPLDGWTILSSFLSPKARFDLRSFVQYGPFVLLLLILFEPQLHFFRSVIYPITDWVTTQLLRL